MISGKVRGILDNLPLCDPSLFGLIVKMAWEYRRVKVFITHSTIDATFHLLKDDSAKFEAIIIDELYERLWYEFVEQGMLPTHKFEEIDYDTRVKKVYLIKIETEEFRNVEKTYRKSTESMVQSVHDYNIYRRESNPKLCKVRVKKEAGIKEGCSEGNE